MLLGMLDNILIASFTLLKSFYNLCDQSQKNIAYAEITHARENAIF